VPRDRLRDIASHRREGGILLDFDGTLSEIAPTPEEARPVENAAATLDELATEFRVVAVVSGRRAAEVAQLLGADVRYFGLYGLEDDAAPLTTKVPAFIEQLLPDVRRVADDVPGARVEHKGVQLAVHYRGAPDPVAASGALRERLRLLAEAQGLTLLEGKRVLELVPTNGPSKGDVVRSLATEAGLRYLLYAGDDVADLASFEALDRLSAAGVGAVKIAVRSLETPEALLSEADMVVEGPRGLIDLLGSMLQE
jgi:trehalose 6-phosphate phosphatase